MDMLIIIVLCCYLFSFIIYGLIIKLPILNGYQSLMKITLKAFLFSLLNAPVLCVIGGHSALFFPVPLYISVAAYLPPELFYSYLPPGSGFVFRGGWLSFIIVLVISGLYLKYQTSKLKESDSID